MTVATAVICGSLAPMAGRAGWLRAAYPPTISQDTSVWKMINIRPRLIQ